jgi:hypothetical protein
MFYFSMLFHAQYWNDFLTFYNNAELDKINEFTEATRINQENTKLMEEFNKRSSESHEKSMETLRNIPHQECEEHFVIDHYVRECRTVYG